MKTLPTPRSRARGFTLVEMMVSLAVLAVMLAIVPPSLATLASTSKMRAAQSELISSLMVARSEAGKRGKTVYVTATTPTTGNEFAAGWSVWVDEDDSADYNAGDTLVRKQADLSGGVVLGTTGNVTQVAFAPSGFVSGNTSVTFKVCGKNDTSKGFSVALQPVGLADLNDTVACP